MRRGHVPLHYECKGIFMEFGCFRTGACGLGVASSESFGEKQKRKGELLVKQWHSYPDKEVGDAWRNPILAARYIDGIFTFTISCSKAGEAVHETMGVPKSVTGRRGGHLIISSERYPSVMQSPLQYYKL